MRGIQSSQVSWSYLCGVLTSEMCREELWTVILFLPYRLTSNCLQKSLFSHTSLKYYSLNLNLFVNVLDTNPEWLVLFHYVLLLKKVWSNAHWFYLFILFSFCGASKDKNSLSFRYINKKTLPTPYRHTTLSSFTFYLLSGEMGTVFNLNKFHSRKICWKVSKDTSFGPGSLRSINHYKF